MRRKKALSMLLAAAVAVSNMAVPVLAAEDVPVEIQVDEEAAVGQEAEEDEIVVEEPTEEGESQEAVAAGECENLIYGTVDIYYDDFYYGEINDVQADLTTAVPNLEAEDAPDQAGYEETGYYDAVTSATRSKAANYNNNYKITFGTTTEDAVTLEGIHDAQIAVNEDLYNAVKELNDTEKESCKNMLVHYIDNMTVVSDTEFKDYKVLNANGTFSATVETEPVQYPSNTSAEISTRTTWGNYLVEMSTDMNVGAANLQGAVIDVKLPDGETEKIGLKHLDNLWFQTYEFSFCIEETSILGHYAAQYERFKDLNIEGATITKVTYMLKDQADLVLETNLLCKKLLSQETTYLAAEAQNYNAAGTTVPLTWSNLPDELTGGDYTMTSVEGISGAIAATEYSISTDNSAVTFTGNCHPGLYTLTFENDTYENIYVDVTINSNMNASSVFIKNNQLNFIDSLSTMADYLKQVTEIVVNGESKTGTNAGNTVFDENGNINFVASINSHGNVTTFFENGADADYEIIVKASGFPDLTAKVGKSYAAQTIQTASSVTKTYGDADFALGAKAVAAAGAGVLSYSSSNTNVATVSSNGTVKVVGAGSTVITVKAAETSNYLGVETKVTLTVNKATPTITASSVTKTYGAKAFSLGASTTGSTLSYKSGNTGVATISATGKVTLKAPGVTTITITSAVTSNYNSANKTVTVTVKPKKVTSVKAVSNARKKATISWKKDKTVTGYEIVLATNSKFTKNRKTVTVKSYKTYKKIVKSLKSKNYYVKVRAYKTSGGSKIYGAYSKTVKVKVK